MNPEEETKVEVEEEVMDEMGDEPTLPGEAEEMPAEAEV